MSQDQHPPTRGRRRAEPRRHTWVDYAALAAAYLVLLLVLGQIIGRFLGYW